MGTDWLMIRKIPTVGHHLSNLNRAKTVQPRGITIHNRFQSFLLCEDCCLRALIPVFFTQFECPIPSFCLAAFYKVSRAKFPDSHRDKEDSYSLSHLLLPFSVISHHPQHCLSVFNKLLKGPVLFAISPKWRVTLARHYRRNSTSQCQGLGTPCKKFPYSQRSSLFAYPRRPKVR